MSEEKNTIKVIDDTIKAVENINEVLKTSKAELIKLENDKEIWHLRVVGEDRFVDVVNPHLQEAQIEQLSSQISLILQVDL